MKIALMTMHDCAGIAYRLHQYLPNSSHIVYKSYPYYGRQFCVEDDGIKNVQDIVDESDIVHFFGDNPIKDYVGINFGDKPKVLTVTGSGFRRQGDKRTAYPYCSEEEIMRGTDFRLVSSPELNYEWFKSEWMPCIAGEELQYCWEPPTNRIWICHSTSASGHAKKGTGHICRAVKKLAEDFPVSLRVIEGVSTEECVERRRGCHINIGELVCGTYGYSAIEGMALGIPTITLDLGYAPHDLPVISAHEDNIYEVLKDTILNVDLEDYSVRSFEYVNKYHRYPKIVERHLEIYKMLLGVH